MRSELIIILLDYKIYPDQISIPDLIELKGELIVFGGSAKYDSLLKP